MLFMARDTRDIADKLEGWTSTPGMDGVALHKLALMREAAATIRVLRKQNADLAAALDVTTRQAIAHAEADPCLK